MSTRNTPILPPPPKRKRLDEEFPNETWQVVAKLFEEYFTAQPKKFKRTNSERARDEKETDPA
jgi:hypothetical protein